MRGKIVDVLVEGKTASETGRYKGTTSNYVPVYLDGSDSMNNTFVQVRVGGLLHEHGVIGSLLPPAA